MNSNTELNYQVTELQDKISKLFDKFRTLQTSMNFIMDVISTNPEYNVTKNRLEFLVSLSKNLTTDNPIDNFFEIKSLAYDVEKMIFDLEHIIDISDIETSEPEVPTIPEPEIEKELPTICCTALTHFNNIPKGFLASVTDKDLAITNIIYTLKNLNNEIIETQVSLDILEHIEFSKVEPGTYYLVTTSKYNTGSTQGEINSNSNIITII